MTQKIHTLQLDLTMKLINEISKIDRFDAEWNSIERREGATLKQLKSIATVRSTGASTRIEGSKMTDKEVEVLINRLKIATLNKRDQQEVAGYFTTLDIITENYRDIQVQERDIKNLHKILMQFNDKDEWHRGNYKQQANSVDETHLNGTKRTIFQTTEPGLATEIAMQNLINWYNTDHETLPIIKIALFVYDFLSIHPFQDGNGRLSRLLGTLLLLKSGYSWVQYVSFEHEIENRKVDYYGVLMHTQRQRPGENVSEWLIFFMDCLLKIQNQLEDKLRTQQTIAKLSNKNQLIINFIDNNPYSKSSEMAEKLGLNLPTVKKILANLLMNRTISKVGTGRSTAYINETSKLIKQNVQFILKNSNRIQNFQLNSPIQEIVIKKIILTPKFTWTIPTEWGERATQQNLGFIISIKSKIGSISSVMHSITSMISDFHYQPVFDLEIPINIPLSIIEETPFQYEYPLQIEIALNNGISDIDFDVHFIYDAVL
ncbi:MAG: Fic family protein [Bacteroidota bacterium]